MPSESGEGGLSNGATPIIINARARKIGDKMTDVLRKVATKKEMAKSLAAVVHQQQPNKSFPKSGPIQNHSYNGNLILGRHFWNTQDLTFSCNLALKMSPK